MYQPQSQPIDPESLLSHKRVRELVGGVSTTWLWRAEKRGRFPRRVYISKTRPVWRAREVMEYLHDPEAWQARNA